MANYANRVLLVFKLRCVAAGTGLVRGKSRLRGIIAAGQMTEQTRNGLMARAVVPEFGKINIFHFVRDGHILRQRLKRAFGLLFLLHRTRAGGKHIAESNQEK